MKSLYQFVSIRNDITKRKQYEQSIQKMAFYDPLTDLPNRNLMNKRLKKLLHNQQMIDKQIAILFLDLDRFKYINDTLGHNAGDLLLKKIGDRIKSCLRDGDFLSRQGGDEFIIILDDIKDTQEVASIANKILFQFSYPFYIGNEKVITTTSIGISLHSFRDQQISSHEDISTIIEKLIKEADGAMFYAKKLGGNSYQFNTLTINQKMLRKSTLEKELKEALEKSEFKTVYQPIVSLKNKNIIGVETLLRWKSQKFGSVSPAEFIPILEETGLIVPIGKWVLKEACLQMKEWEEMGTAISRISVNISPRQFLHNQFVTSLKEILNETGLAPNKLDIEITETIIKDFKESIKILNELKLIGLHISIDDFGTGYSSLSYLKYLPIDHLKIDKSFINDLDKDGEVIAKTIIDMGRNLNFKIIAEGIETEKQQEFLQTQKCDFGQGYYYSKPVDPDEISTFCTKVIGNK